MAQRNQNDNDSQEMRIVLKGFWWFFAKLPNTKHCYWTSHFQLLHHTTFACFLSPKFAITSARRARFTESTSYFPCTHLLLCRCNCCNMNYNFHNEINLADCSWIDRFERFSKHDMMQICYCPVMCDQNSNALQQCGFHVFFHRRSHPLLLLLQYYLG